MHRYTLFVLVIIGLLWQGPLQGPLQAGKPEPAFPAAAGQEAQYAQFPKPVNSFADSSKSVWERIQSRAKAEPFQVVATAIFALAILHTFFAGFLHKLSVKADKEHHERLRQHADLRDPEALTSARTPVSFKATVLEFLGEVEAVFAIWAIPLLVAACFFYGPGQVKNFVAYDSTFTEPMFVVVIMIIAATRPVVKFAELCLSRVAAVGGGSPTAWWLTLLTVAPLLGSFITEPAAMTLAALLLSKKFFALEPPKIFKYATLGLLFVNVSVGGVLTNFAAPPVLMVAGPDKWNWSTLFMLQHFGIKSVIGILCSTLVAYFVFKKTLRRLASHGVKLNEAAEAPIPRFITVTHLLALLWTVLTAHYPAFFIGGFLFFLGFLQATDHHQERLRHRGPIMVGFFLAGLVIHGRLQGWWLEPILSSGINEWGLHLGAAGLTAVNDNALITFLASQVPNLSDSAKFAIVSGAVAGGGLTVIANAPNPAGQALLKKHFPSGISPLGLFLGALVPTAICIGCMMLLPR